MGEGVRHRGMTPKTRLRVWAGVVVACFVAIGLVIAGRWLALPWIAAGGALSQGLGVAAVAWLLATTPADAIRLKATTSWAVIGVGFALNVIAAGSHVMAVLSVVAVPVRGWVLVRRGLSPWWTVLFVWSSAMGVVGVMRPELGPSVRSAFNAATALAWMGSFVLVLGLTRPTARAVGVWASALLVLSGVCSAAVWVLS